MSGTPPAQAGHPCRRTFPHLSTALPDCTVSPAWGFRGTAGNLDWKQDPCGPRGVAKTTGKVPRGSRVEGLGVTVRGGAQLEKWVPSDFRFPVRREVSSFFHAGLVGRCLVSQWA